MNVKLLFAGSARQMLRYKMRTLFMTLGIVVGVAALLFMRAMGVGAERAILDNFNRSFSTATISIMAGGARMSARGGADVTSLKIEDFEAVEAEIPGVVAWGVMQWAPDQDVRHQGALRKMRVVGYSENPEPVWQRGLMSGTHFSIEDMRSAARVAVIGTRAAEALFGADDPIGKQIQVGTVPFRIIGVLEPKGIDTHGGDKDDELHVPVTTLLRRIMNVDHLFAGRVVIDNPSKVDETAKRIVALIANRHGIPADEPPDVMAVTPRLVQDMVSNANRVLGLYLPAAAGVALLVAAIVIANIMLIAVRERVPEIGIRKAVGAEDGQISFQFLTEAVVVALTAGIIGAVIGIAAALTYGALGSTPMVVTPGAVLLGLGAAVVVGVVAGAVPARQAAQLDPVGALR